MKLKEEHACSPTFVFCLFALLILQWSCENTDVGKGKERAKGVTALNGGTLHISLTIDDARLLYQQDTYCSITLQNDGAHPIDILVPPLDVSLPIVRVIDVRTGAEETYRRKPPPRSMPHEPGQLLPGDSVKSGFSLFDIVPCLPPGDYDICTTWEFNGGEGMAESLAARLKVLPTTPKSISMADAFGGYGNLKYGVWVNLAGDPDEPGKIVRNRFSFEAGGGVSHVLEVADCGRTCRPVVSSPAVGTVAASQWVAWVDGSVLHFTHVDDELGVASVHSHALPEDGFKIVPPLYSGPVLNAAVRPPGAVLLYHGAAGATEFRSQVVDLGTEQSKTVNVSALPGPEPAWIMSHIRSHGERFASYVQAAGGKVLLFLTPWVGSGRGLVEPVRLASWNGAFVGSGAAMDREGTLHGGTLILGEDERGNEGLQMVRWFVSPDNVFQEVRRQDVGWPSNETVGKARIAVSDEGKTGALISDAEGCWQVYDGDGHLVSVPAEIQKTRLALELGFMDGSGELLLIAGMDSRGFRIMGLDGSPLPPRQTEE